MVVVTVAVAVGVGVAVVVAGAAVDIGMTASGPAPMAGTGPMTQTMLIRNKDRFMFVRIDYCSKRTSSRYKLKPLGLSSRLADQQKPPTI